MSTSSLIARLSGILDVTSVDLPIVGASTSDILQPGTEQMTASEHIANSLPGDAPTGAMLRSAGIYHRGQRCLDRGEFSHAPAVARRTVPIPGDFMPSQHRLDSYVVAGAERKAHTLRWMWAAPASLQWFCGAIENRRGFEEEVRVPQAESFPRWSTNWYKTPQGKMFRKTNLPGAVPDDLACGKPKISIIVPSPTCDGLNPFETQSRPDFSLTSAMGHSFRYGKWYYTKFRTNAGETSDPDSILQYSATATTRPRSSGGEAEFCNLSKIKGRPNAEPASCMFTRNIVCLSRARTFRQETLKMRQNFRDAPHRCDL